MPNFGEFEKGTPDELVSRVSSVAYSDGITAIWSKFADLIHKTTGGFTMSDRPAEQ